MLVSPAGYAHMTAMLQTIANGKVVIALEGGYNLRAVSTSACASLKVLLGAPPPSIAGGAVRADARRDIEAAVSALAPYWKCLQPPPPVAPRLDAKLEWERAARRAARKRQQRRRRRAPWWHKYF